jgi:hypothetical protein
MSPQNVEFKLAVPLRPIMHLTIAEMAALPLDMHCWIQSLWTMRFTSSPEAIFLHHVVGDVFGPLVHATAFFEFGILAGGCANRVCDEFKVLGVVILAGGRAIFLSGGFDVIHAGGGDDLLEVRVLRKILTATWLIELEKLEKDNDLLWTWCARRPVSARQHERGCSAQKRSQVPATQHSTVCTATPKGMPRQSTTRAICQLQQHK